MRRSRTQRRPNGCRSRRRDLRGWVPPVVVGRLGYRMLRCRNLDVVVPPGFDGLVRHQIVDVGGRRRHLAASASGASSSGQAVVLERDIVDDRNRVGRRFVIDVRRGGLGRFDPVVCEVLVRPAACVARLCMSQSRQQGLIGSAAQGATFHQPIDTPHAGKPNGTRHPARTPTRDVAAGGSQSSLRISRMSASRSGARSSSMRGWFTSATITSPTSC